MTTVPEALVAAPTAEESQGDRYRPIEWNICKRLFHYMWRYPRTQIFICLCAIAIAAIHSLTPLVITETIRRTIERPELWTEPTGLTPLQGVITGAGLVSLLAVTYYVIMRMRMRLVSRLAEHVVYDLRHDIFSHVQRLDMAYFDRTKLGRILSRGTSDVSAVRNAVAEIVPRTLIHGLMMVGLFIIMLTFDWVLALILLAMAPVLWFVSNIFRRRMGHAYRAVQESFSRLTANIAESIAGIRVTQAFSREQRNDDLFRNLCLTHRARNMSAAKIHGVYIPLFEVSSQLIAAIIVIVGGYRVANGYMDVSDLIGFLLCTGGFFISIIILAELYNTTLQAMAGGERIFALLDTEPRIHDAPDARDLARTPRGARVEFDGVTFGYDPQRPVLRDISFTAEPGHVVALVGHTGSGKTSIVSLITRLYAHQQGDIRIDGQPIQQLTLHSLHRQVGLVLQDNFLFTGTVAQNIRFARPGATDDQVRDACQALDCLDVLEALPERLETQVGERGSALSLGQRQLVCFARAMIADPRLLMLDEATSAVDTFTEYRIQRALERLMANRTSIVVAHRLSTVRRANQILVLEAGQIIERGDHDTLMSTGGHYSTLYNEFIRLSSE
jgi:ATP-binding cassette subfamily B protein